MLTTTVSVSSPRTMDSRTCAPHIACDMAPPNQAPIAWQVMGRWIPQLSTKCFKQWNLETSFNSGALIFSCLFHLVPDLTISTRVFEFWSFPRGQCAIYGGSQGLYLSVWKWSWWLTDVRTTKCLHQRMSRVICRSW